jgi:amidase
LTGTNRQTHHPRMADDDDVQLCAPTGSAPGSAPSSVRSAAPNAAPSAAPNAAPIDRRDLFRTGATLGATLIVGAALPACSNREEPRPAPAIKPTAQHAAAAEVEVKAKAQATALESMPAMELMDLTFADLQARMAKGTDSAKSLVQKYRQRIDAVDRKGPMLRSVLEHNPEAETIAEQLDAERAAGKLRGPLHGLPILIKDNIDTGDKMTTTAGSLALEGSHAAKDAFVVARLREAGAIILGKTNMSEWANFRGMASSSGWSGRGGQCRNPYALDRSPSGSSSGSGAATAASLCAAAIGSETDGSIVSPSSCNGLVGIKPTIGLVSRAGVIPLSTSQDTLGPMARSVADAAAILTVIAGPDPADPVTTAPHKLRPAAPEDYAKYLDLKALSGARIGVPRKGLFGISRGLDNVIRLALVQLRDLGAVLVDPADLVVPPELGAAETEVLLTELKVSLNQYLAGRGKDAKVHSLAEAIAFNTGNSPLELPIFGQEYFVQAEAKTGLDDVMNDEKLDAFVAPTNSPAWMIDPVNGDGGGGVSCSSLPAVAGYPHITVPAGDYRGLPVGLSFFGRPFSEGKLISYAYAYEQATKLRTPPRFLPTVELV